MTDPVEIWAYLSRGPLLWLTATLVTYTLADALSRWTGRRPLANPVLLAVAPLALLLWATGTSYATYFEGAQFIHFLLGPATVALALPLARSLPLLRQALLPSLAALAAGSLTAVGMALGVAHALGVPPAVLAAIAPKSATAPVAIGVAEGLGGSPTLTAVLVIATGITGAVIGAPLLNALRVRDWRARGFAIGVAAHGIGTARPFRSTRRPAPSRASAWA